MKKFISKSIIFSIIIIVINTFFYAVVYSYYYKEYGKIDAGYSRYLISDSHGAALSEYTMEYSIYNFSDTTDSYHDMLRKLKYLIKHTSVRTVYLTVDATTLSPYRTELNNMDRSSKFLSLSDYPNPYSFIKERIIEKYLVIFNPKGRDVIKVYLESLLSSKKDESLIWSEMSQEQKKQECEKRFELQFGYPGPSAELKMALTEIIELCKKNNIELIGIKYPISRIYLDIIGNKNFGADRIFLENNLKVMDFTRAFSDMDEYFADQDHMNSRGGKAFVKLLIKSLGQNPE